MLAKPKDVGGDTAVNEGLFIPTSRIRRITSIQVLHQRHTLSVGRDVGVDFGRAGSQAPPSWPIRDRFEQLVEVATSNRAQYQSDCYKAQAFHEYASAEFARGGIRLCQFVGQH